MRRVAPVMAGVLGGLMVVGLSGVSQAQDSSDPSGGADFAATPAQPTSHTPSLAQFEQILSVISGSLEPDQLSQGLDQMRQIYGAAPSQEPMWGTTLSGYAPFNAPALDHQTRQKMVDDLNEQLNSPNAEADAFQSDAKVRDAMLSAVNAEPDPAKRQELLGKLDEMEKAAQPLRNALDEILQNQ